MIFVKVKEKKKHNNNNTIRHLKNIIDLKKKQTRVSTINEDLNCPECTLRL